MPEKFDFAKIEDREKFEKLSKENQEEIVFDAREKAIEMEKGRQEVLECIARMEFDAAERAKNVFDLPQEMLISAAKEAIIGRMKGGTFNFAIDIKNHFNLPGKIIRSAEVQSACSEAMIERLTQGDVDSAYKIKNDFDLSEGESLFAAKNGMVKRLANGGFKDISIILKKFDLPDEFLKAPEIISAVKSGLVDKLSFEGNIETALKIKDDFGLDEEVFQSALKESMIKILERGGINNASKIKDHLKLTEEFIQLPEIRNAAQLGLGKILGEGDMNGLIYSDKIINDFNLSKEDTLYAVREGLARLLFNEHAKGFNDTAKIKKHFGLSEEDIGYAVENAARQILKYSGGNSIDRAIKITAGYNLSKKSIESIGKESAVMYLSYGDIDKARRIFVHFPPSPNFIQSKEAQFASQKGVLANLRHGNIEDAYRIIKFGKLSEEFLRSSEAQIAAVGGVIEKIKYGKIDDVIEIIKRINLPRELIESTEVQSAAEEGLVRELKSFGKIDVVAKIKELFGLSDKVVEFSAQEAMIDSIAKGNIYAANKLKDNFNLSSEFIQSEDMKTAAKKGATRRLTEGSIEDAIKIKELFSLPVEAVIFAVQEAIKDQFHWDKSIEYVIEIANAFDLPIETMQSVARDGVIAKLAKGNINAAIVIKNAFKLPEEIVQLAVKKGMIESLEKGNVSSVIEILEYFNLPTEIIEQSDITLAAKKRMLKELSDLSIDNAIKIKEAFSLSIKSQEIINCIPEVNDFIEEIKNISSEFYEQIFKSVDLAISICSFANNPNKFLETIKENPFLLGAVSENPRFGSKLLIKYPQFDDLSKHNIKILFDTKNEILTNNPEIDPESLEFRQLIQKKLEGYQDNFKIVDELKRQGIDIDQWLNYSETQYFNLGSSESHLAFSETVSAPINRIKETLDSYAHTLKEVLKQYHPELSEFRIPLEDAREIEAKIAQMQIELEKAKNEGNEKKAQGIEKGIEGLKKKLENIKTVALWDKLLGDISAFQQLKNDVFQAQENLIKAENDLQEKLSGKMPSGRMIQELKEKINKSKEELRSKFSVLERRIDYLKDHLWTTLSPCLGDETTGALMQEIQTNLAEQFDHYDADRGTLSNLFSERSDKDKEKMENQPMSIFVWARNPDVDLYQGNYSPCCICIDSAHMGAESTIADYNTDLGIQIVNIWDETKNEPVTAAWCWVGKNVEGEMALVVDNIESNTQYSANYSEQLSKELFDYLKNYAKSIGVKKIVLGKANNDLPTSGELAKMKDDENKYEKVGGYNRPDGYFLEAEDKTVKILWENLEPIEKVMQKVEKVAKVEFKDLNIKNLSEKDFEKIKKLEKKIYKDTGLALGQAMIEDMKSGNGLEYSIVASGKRPEGKRQEAVGYLVALEDETDEGDPCVYLEDIALLPEAQGQQIGWDMMKNLIAKLKEKAKKENKPVLLDMHLRETSQRFFERYHDELGQMGVKLLEEALVPDYYDEGEDSLYKVYQIKAD